MFYTKEGLNLTDIMFLGRWKSAAVLRYMEEAMAELPVNKRPQAITPEIEVPVANPGCEVPERPMQSEDVSTARQLVKGPEIKAQGSSKKPLSAVPRGRRGNVSNRVGKASWGLPISEWTTLCGWHFAKANAKVELTRFKDP